MMLISFLVINAILIGIGFAAGFLWGNKNCQDEIEVAFKEGYDAGYFANPKT